uniref:Uncharacterized protein n=1 Tax=Ditylenchus dipsaci TaxID=166011 RepID=A0A915CQL2_9BILA
MPIMVCILLVGSLNGTIFVSSRFLHAASRGGFLPTFISCTNPETDSPRAALVVHLLLVFTMTFTADLHALINYIGFAQWSQRGITMSSLIVPVLFFLICFSLCLVTIIEETKSALVSVIVLSVTFLIYMVFIYEKALPSQTWYTRTSSKVDSFTTSIFQVMFNTMPQRIKMMEGASAKKKEDHQSNGLNNKEKKTRKIAPSAD